MTSLFSLAVDEITPEQDKSTLPFGWQDIWAPPFHRWTTKRLLGLLLKQSPFLCQ